MQRAKTPKWRCHLSSVLAAAPWNPTLPSHGRLLRDLLGEGLEVDLLSLLREPVRQEPPVLGERRRLPRLQPLPRADRLELDPGAGRVPHRERQARRLV